MANETSESRAYSLHIDYEVDHTENKTGDMVEHVWRATCDELGIVAYGNSQYDVEHQMGEGIKELLLKVLKSGD